MGAGRLYAQTSTAPTGPAEDLHCAKEISIYLDLSGTMTMQPRRGERNNLNRIAETLHELLIRQNGFVLERDRVNILLFGTEVRTIRSFELEDQQDLDTLSLFLRRIQDPNPNVWIPTVTDSNAIPLESISAKTDFGELFGDMASRSAGGAERQVFIIASDLVQDTIGLPVGSDQNVEERIQNFDTAFERFESDQRVVAAFGGAGGPVRARMAVIAIDAVGGDQEVAASARSKFESLNGTKVIDRKGGAAPTAALLREYFTFPVTIAIDPEEYQKTTDSTFLHFIATNPNCGRVTVRQVMFSGGGEKAAVAIDDGLIDASGRRMLDIDAKELNRLWGSEVTVTPVIAEKGKIEETKFWLGDFVRFKSISLQYFPRPSGVGRTLLVANVYLRLKSTSILSIVGLPSGTKKFRIDAEDKKNDLVLAFDVAHGTPLENFPKKIVIESDGPMLMDTRSIRGQRRLELPVDGRQTEPAASRNQYATFAAIVLIVVAGIAAATKRTSLFKVVDWIDRAIFIRDFFIAYLPGVGYLITKIAWWFFERWYLSIMIWRSFALALVFCFAARQITISWIWPLLMEKSTLFTDEAITRRHWLAVAIWMLTLTIFVLSAIDFYVAGIPETARILEEISQ